MWSIILRFQFHWTSNAQLLYTYLTGNLHLSFLPNRNCGLRETSPRKRKTKKFNKKLNEIFFSPVYAYTGTIFCIVDLLPFPHITSREYFYSIHSFFFSFQTPCTHTPEKLFRAVIAGTLNTFYYFIFTRASSATMPGRRRRNAAKARAPPLRQFCFFLFYCFFFFAQRTFVFYLYSIF